MNPGADCDEEEEMRSSSSRLRTEGNGWDRTREVYASAGTSARVEAIGLDRVGARRQIRMDWVQAADTATIRPQGLILSSSGTMRRAHLENRTTVSADKSKLDTSRHAFASQGRTHRMNPGNH